MKKLVFSLVAILFLGFSAQAQMNVYMPQPSPAASVMQQVGFNKITIDYSSPGVKGREIYGDLLPWGTPWRAGANAATKISFSTPVTINGKDLAAGDYSLFITPMEDGKWTVHLNSKGNSVYAYMKDDKVDKEALMADDAVMVEAKVEDAPMKERLSYYISAEDNKQAMITMYWADKMVSFPVDVRTEYLMERMKGAF